MSPWDAWVGLAILAVCVPIALWMLLAVVAWVFRERR